MELYLVSGREGCLTLTLQNQSYCSVFHLPARELVLTYKTIILNTGESQTSESLNY
jgi:hypothetical protein